MNKRASLVVGVLLGEAALALWLYHPHTSKDGGLYSGPGLPPTPAQKARLKARLNKVYRRDQDAAAALDAGQYAEAEADARQSMAAGPDSGIAQELLAAALDGQGKTQEALKVYARTQNDGGRQARNILPYALLLLKTGHWAQAVTAYNKARPFADGTLISAKSHFSPAVPRPRDLETAIHTALGLSYGSEASWGRHLQIDKALSEHKQALALEPNSALANYYYGYTLRRIGRRAEAQAFFKKAVALGSDDAKVAAQREIR